MASHNLDMTLGALFIGAIISTFFQGVLSTQAYVYYEAFPFDSWCMKTLVAFIWMSDFAHQCMVLHAMYYYSITSWGIPENLAFSVPTFSWHIFVIGITTMACHAFFIRRIYVLGKSKFTLCILVLAVLGHLVLEIVVSVELTKDVKIASYGNYTHLVIPMLVLGACIDAVMALLLMFYVHKERSGIRRSENIINKIIQYAVATGFATSLLGFASAAAFLVKSEGSFVYIPSHRLFT